MAVIVLSYSPGGSSTDFYRSHCAAVAIVVAVDLHNQGADPVTWYVKYPNIDAI